MKSAIARFDPSTARQPVERRRQKRRQLGNRATLRLNSGEQSPIKLCDMSPSGCNIEGRCEDLRAGSFVLIGLEPDDFIGAIVRWVRRDRAGMEFLREIGPERTAWHDLMHEAG